MSSGTSIRAPRDGSFVSRDIVGLNGNPVARERAVVGTVFNGYSGRQLFETLDKTAIGMILLFRQL